MRRCLYLVMRQAVSLLLCFQALLLALKLAERHGPYEGGEDHGVMALW